MLKTCVLSTCLRLVFISLFVSYCLFATAFSASVRQVTINEMVNASELIFEGRVVSEVSRWTPDNTQIRTYVSFQIEEVIKGDHPGGTIELSFQGGTVGDLTLSVSDMQVPQPGERGIYVVESLTRRQIHPFYGWDQGHFLLASGPDGVDIVTTWDGRKIIALLPEQEAALTTLSTGVALGVRTSAQGDAKGLTADDFKKRVRELLAEAQ